MDKEKKFVSLVVYLHDNQNEIEEFLKKIIGAMTERFAQFELVCVDDACTDDTVEVIRHFLSVNNISSNVNIVHMSYYQGLESAMNAGRDFAIGDFVFEFDSCLLDYDYEILETIYNKLLSGYDIVSAMPKGKVRFSSRMFYKVFNAFSKEKVGKLGTNTVRIMSRRAINRIRALGNYIPYRKAVYANCGLKTASVEYERTCMLKKKGTASERVSLAVDSLVYFTNALERVSTFLSCVFLIATIGLGVFALVDLFAGHRTADGWLSIMGFLAIGFLGVFVLLTIVLKYLSALINLVFKQQRYIISDVDKITPKDVQNI